eukprot:TRINITY_DN3040_c0_g1_i1.p1 TRINITY_DN3040_c0_g1~~TRINITY_DN3040_c0_g1_i1.p1  ORF type:complete len:156 (-),score=22.95 TRINITY_DN3040_c0_g1_i1:19-465(-)
MELYAIPYILGIISVDSIYDLKTISLPSSNPIEEIMLIRDYFVTQDTSYLSFFVPILLGMIVIGIVGNVIRKVSIPSVLQLLLLICGGAYFGVVVDPVRQTLLDLDRPDQGNEILSVLKVIVVGHYVLVGVLCSAFVLGIIIKRQENN